MNICEMCGKEGELADSIVEGVMMGVCVICSDYGKVVPINKPIIDKKLEMKRETEDAGYIEVVVDNYANLIQKAREKKGLKQEDLAKAIAEKESVIHQLESSKLKPNFKLAQKLEVFLNIKVLEKVETNLVNKRDVSFKSTDLTIGDLLSGED
jgi:putative transcription factor